MALFDNRMKSFSFICVFMLTGCGPSDHGLTETTGDPGHSLAGRWLADSQLGDRGRVISETLVDDHGRYTIHLTNFVSDGFRTATAEGTLEIRDGLLIDTITNDVSGNTQVPRVVSVAKIIRWTDDQLILSDTNTGIAVTYRRANP